ALVVLGHHDDDAVLDANPAVLGPGLAFELLLRAAVGPAGQVPAVEQRGEALLGLEVFLGPPDRARRKQQQCNAPQAGHQSLHRNSSSTVMPGARATFWHDTPAGGRGQWTPALRGTGGSPVSSAEQASRLRYDSRSQASFQPSSATRPGW